MASVCLQVCVLCGEGADATSEAAGRRLYRALREACREASGIDVRAVDCLAVCDRPVTLVFRSDSPGRWSYLVGGADPRKDPADILAAARAVAASEHGVPAMAERPPFFRDGVIARLPPARRLKSDRNG